MKCSTCGHDNSETLQFCVRCHTPLRFTCPACQHVQSHGSQCEACGVNFLNYASMLAFASLGNLQQERRRKNLRHEIVRQILLLPITGGWSLLKFFRGSRGGD